MPKTSELGVSKRPSTRFRFRSLDHIGAAAAEDDLRYLQECFVDTGALASLRQCTDSRSIVVGRTGTGKTALLLMLRTKEDRTIEVPPESLALSYISNSNILQFFSSVGVKLDIFFKLLWRHIFTVEILKHHFNLGAGDKTSLLSRLQGVFRDKKHQRALTYLEMWGKSFWEETEYRIKEVTSTLEGNLKASVGGQAFLGSVPFTLEGARKLTEEQRVECLERAQKVVNAVQIRELSDVIDLIDHILTDPQKRYFVLIDRLDEDWIEESLRYRLIRALIETVRDFRAVQNAKIVVALRLDLLDRVYRLTRDPGFQEEKYESLST